MPFYCTDGCGEYRPAGGLKKPCPNCGELSAERIPPLDGWMEFSTDDAPTDEEAQIAKDEYFQKRRDNE